MSKPSVTSFLMAGIIICITVIFIASFPYIEKALALIFISLMLMSFLSEKFLFLFMIAIVIAFGAFLTIVAFLTEQNENQQVSFMLLHLLVTICLLLNWILMYVIKSTESENKGLTEKVHMLQKHMSGSQLLTNHEFIEQAKRILRGTSRRDEEAWLLELHLTLTNKHTKKSYREVMEQLAFKSIRDEYDLVTSTESTILVLLQNTSQAGVDIVKRRIENESKSSFNDIYPSFAFKEQILKNVAQIEVLLKEQANG